jgi:hypothetical protein
MDSDSEEEAELPYAIGRATNDGDFDRVKAWLASASINRLDNTGWTLLHWTAVSRPPTPGHVEFARYLISQGVRVDAQSQITKSTALHYACDNTSADMVSMLLAAGASINIQTKDGDAPLFFVGRMDASESSSQSNLDIVTILLRAGASLDSSTRSFEEYLNLIDQGHSYATHLGAVRTLVASVRAAGSWKAHCRLAHKKVLRLRSLVARGRAKLPRARRPRGRQERALEFIVRQGDNGVVWHILSFWREAA